MSMTMTQKILAAHAGLAITIVEGELPSPPPEKINDVKGNIVARWGGTCGRWDIS